ncbi:hypothetical protein [Candidatus Entotheonella palauensis]|uniref:hypothetical protein n=1 Tax=Candidatus Entotheonella palauensis TaxID=93172 RepID=UPI000B7F80D5|nr:hypothetical protein [Candidatus Entotheonella palauensis]
MATIHIQCVGDKALLPQSELEHLIELAQRAETMTMQRQKDDVPTLGTMHLIEQGGAFGFRKEDGEDIYSVNDGEPV